MFSTVDATEDSQDAAGGEKTVTVAPRPRIDKFIRLEYPAATLPGQPSWMN
jgi:hypothetical protein